jgi:hypothetical protein
LLHLADGSLMKRFLFRIHRSLVVVSAGLLLLGSITHGPGRGMTAMSSDASHAWLYSLSQWLAYVGYGIGGLLCFSRPRLAAWVLLFSLISRSVMELQFSYLKLALSMSGDVFDHISTLGILLIGIFYLFSFVLPGLLWLDIIKRNRSNRAAANGGMQTD